MGVSSVCTLEKLAALETQHAPGAAPQLKTDDRWHLIPPLPHLPVGVTLKCVLQGPPWSPE